MTSGEMLSIGELSKQSGVHIETIRYYEKIGVMPPPSRSAGGYRLYEAEHLKRLSFVRRSRQLGFSLDEIRGLLHLVDRDAYTCVQVRELALRHMEEIRRKIADLKRLKQVMEEMSAQCSNDRAPECAIIDALFDMRQRRVAISPGEYGETKLKTNTKARKRARQSAGRALIDG
jgi:MerR family mercuric resistance operon transcriptional regulator